MSHARRRPTTTAGPLADKNWAGPGYNQPGPQGQDLGPGAETDRGGFTGAALSRRQSPEHQQDREAGE
jgi:hypothetical protein